MTVEAHKPDRRVRIREEWIALPTYEPASPDKNPMFLEKRVYQGSSGKVYPLPFTDRVASKKTLRRWRAVWLENRYLRVMVLPEIGGRIHVAQDKTNGYDFIYRQTVIKPALVGLAGPWISGGIEFNWPQHHRPATFMPVDYQIEEHADGSKTVWCSDHDPMSRMKGMHGVCLHPDRAYIELKVRVHNRTPMAQTFLWWANVAARVHEGYQSFFPPDVYYVADHAKRAVSEYPLCRGHYYGVNYGERGLHGIPVAEVPSQFIPPHCLKPEKGKSKCDARNNAAVRDLDLPQYAANDLSFYANIPTPCSYMCMGSQEDFFGGYDHLRQAGLVHIANHHISPGKKQWTWGNHEFGYAWDRNLTDADGPYIELMAGVYTDNQPDFSFLQPGETRTWSQYWYPIQRIGPVQHANLDAAVSLTINRQRVRIGVSVSWPVAGATIQLEDGHRVLKRAHNLAPGKPFVTEIRQSRRQWPAIGVTLRVLDRDGHEIIAYAPKAKANGVVPPPASEPPPPEVIASADELFVTGQHLDQYRHATRCPTLYWLEALRRDTGDARCNNAMGRWHLRRGEWEDAEAYFRLAIDRLIRRNPNPSDGEPYYHLGLCLRHQMDANGPTAAGLFAEAYAAFYKATWNQAWASAAFHALAEMDCRRADWTAALDHLDRSLRLDCDNTRARNLKTVVLRKLKRVREADALLAETLALDGLDWWARHLSGLEVACDGQTRMDLAYDFARAGLYSEAADLLATKSSAVSGRDPRNLGAEPLRLYLLGWLRECLGQARFAASARRAAQLASPDYCFPSRLEEITVLASAIRASSRDARASYYLGNLLYDRRRHREAIEHWERSARLEPDFSIVWRNLGIAYFNEQKSGSKACRAYDKAFRANPCDARLLYERDQLWKRLGFSPARRLKELQQHPDLVQQRDDLSVEMGALLNQTGRPAQAKELLAGRNFQPWEGGEGQALGQYTRTQLALGRAALRRKDFCTAISHFEQALAEPPNLGEARHLLANQSDIHYWLGEALMAMGRKAEAQRHWRMAATFKGDFQQMSVRSFSEMTYYSALSWARLGRKDSCRRLLRELLVHARKLEKSPAQIDYFATSLPAMLLFEDDLAARQKAAALLLQAQALLGLGRRRQAIRRLRAVLRRDPAHALAFDLLGEL